MKILDAHPVQVTTDPASANPTTGPWIVGVLASIALAALGLVLIAGDASAQAKRAISESGKGTPTSASKIAIVPADSLDALIKKASGNRDEAAPGSVGTDAAESDALTVGSSTVDDAFAAARKAMLAYNLERYDQAILSIPRTHVLYSYVEYWRLRILLGAKQLEALTGDADQPARAFITRYPNTLAADLLRRDWLLALGRRGDWPAFDEQYPQWQLRDESSPECYAHLSTLARLPPGKDLDRKTRNEVHALLMRPVSLNRACTDLFDGMTAAGQFPPQEIRRRLMFALEANATGDIRQSAALLGSALNEKGLDQALNRPAAALKSDQSHDLLLIALTRLARNDPESAAARLRLAGARLSDDDRRFVWSQIAAAGMRRLAPESHLWTREALGAKVSDDTRAWMARAALREQDWPLLRTVILGMSEQERREPQWIFWLGRSRKAEGKTQEADKLFASLAERRDFYGKLANEELGRLTTKPPRPTPPPPAAIAVFDANPGFARALAFYDLGMRFEGNREWNFQLRGLTDAELRAAAHWAMNRGLLDRAINAEERIRGEPDFALRFPTPFSEQLVPITRQQNIDAAWVYGLIRQESRFIMDARSHVGASGLMQIMPATARWIARKIGRSDFKPRDINDLQTNLEFGSFYLKQALDDLDGSAVLASAGYNAGPRRARDWRGTLSRPLEGAIFAEIIPFSETRGYVKNVLSNAIDYAALFSGEPQSLRARLGTIEPRVAGATQLP
ncbi:MAG: transglycosylase SLT domain-containing protein [Lautropia sp.]